MTLTRPGEVAVVERPEPRLREPEDALIRVRASGICGSDMHLFRGRVPAEPGLTLGHEYVGEVLAVGGSVSSLQVGERVIGSFATACGRCPPCRAAAFQHCHRGRLFGLGCGEQALHGTQADLALVPYADRTLRRVPDCVSDAAALLAGDAMATALHAVSAGGLRPGETCAVVGLGPVGLCVAMAARVAGAARVIAVDRDEARIEAARSLGATPVHAGEEDVPARCAQECGGRGADLVVEAVGSTQALATACQIAAPAGRIAVVGVHAEPAAVHMGLIFAKGLQLVAGVANAIAQLDRVLALMEGGCLDPTPLVTHAMPRADAAEAYRAFDRRETLKIMLRG